MILLYFYHHHAGGGTVRRSNPPTVSAEEDEKRLLSNKPTIWNVEMGQSKLEIDDFQVSISLCGQTWVVRWVRCWRLSSASSLVDALPL